MSTKSSMAGWIGFAAIVMLILAGIDVIQGLIALFDDNYYVVSPSGFLVVDLTAWGWALLTYGVILAFGGPDCWRARVGRAGSRSSSCR